MVDNMITLYESDETSFSNNGLGALPDASECLVTEERNGQFELEMEYPINGKRFDEIELWRIIFAKPNPYDDPQPFRIYSVTKPIDGMVTVNAEHISYDLSGYPVTRFTTSSISDTFGKLNTNCPVSHPFTFEYVNDSHGKIVEVESVSNIRSVLMDEENSILAVYGGEFEFDKFKVKHHSSRGENRGVVIRYGKNLTDLEQEENCSNVYTGVFPYYYSTSTDEDGVEIYEMVTLSANGGIINLDGNFNFTRIHMADLTSEFSEKPSEDELREAAENYISENNLSTPEISLTVSFIELARTEEYKDYALLETVHLCDTVGVIFDELGVTAYGKVNKTEYDVLTGRYTEIELGDTRSTLSTQIASGNRSLLEVPTTSAMELAIANATRLITGGLGGYVVIHASDVAKARVDENDHIYPDEILIMNEPEINKATKVWRWNMGGLGYSSNGYDGPFETAITMDGAIVANFITTGTLNASIIKAGTLSDQTGSNYWNLETGSFHMNLSIGSRNYLLNTKDLSKVEGKVYYPSQFSRSEDEDGYGILTGTATGSVIYVRLYTNISADGDGWANQQFSFGTDIKATDLTTTSHYGLGFAIYGSNDGSNWYQTNYLVYPLSRAESDFICNTGEFENNKWIRLICNLICPSGSSMTKNASYGDNEYEEYAYVINFTIRSANTSGTVSIRKPKLELGSTATDWSPAPEDTDSAILEAYHYSDTLVSETENSIMVSVNEVLGSYAKKDDLKSYALVTQVETVYTSLSEAFAGYQQEVSAEFSSLYSGARNYILNSRELTKIAGQTWWTSDNIVHATYEGGTFGGLQIYGSGSSLIYANFFTPVDPSKSSTVSWVGKEFTFSFDGYSPCLKSHPGYHALQIDIYGTDDESNYYQQYSKTWYLSTSLIDINTDDFANSVWTRIICRFTVPSTSDMSKNSSYGDNTYSKQVYVMRVGITASFPSDSHFSVKKPKLEEGTIVSDWSPAPEDGENALSEAKAGLETYAYTTADEAVAVFKGYAEATYGTKYSGSRNYILNSRELSLIAGETYYASPIVHATYEGGTFGGLQIYGDGSSTVAARLYTPVDISVTGYISWVGKDFTFSFDGYSPYLKSNPGYHLIQLNIYGTDDEKSYYQQYYKTWYLNSTAIDINTDDFANTSWTRIICRFTVPSTSDMTKNATYGDNTYSKQVYVMRVGVTSSFTSSSRFSIKKPKLEEGTTVSDWSPAPEDGEESVANAIAYMETYAKAYADGAISGFSDHAEATFATQSAVASIEGKVEAYADSAIASLTLSVSSGSLGNTASITLTSKSGSGSTSSSSQSLDLTNVRKAFANESTSITISAGTIYFVGSSSQIAMYEGHMYCYNDSGDFGGYVSGNQYVDISVSYGYSYGAGMRIGGRYGLVFTSPFIMVRNEYASPDAKNVSCYVGYTGWASIGGQQLWFCHGLLCTDLGA